MAKGKPSPAPMRALKSNSISVLPQCECSHKPHPHSHAKDNGHVPWNWEKTNKIWAEEESKRIKISATKSAKHGNI